MTRYELDRYELGARVAWQLRRDRDITRLDTWLHLRRDVLWLHKGQERLL